MNSMFIICIDITHRFALRCPSCHIGNTCFLDEYIEFMSEKTLTRIIDTVKDQVEITGIGLYNWLSPFLHTNLPQLIQAIRFRYIPCGVSTSLNTNRNLEDILLAKPTSLYVSIMIFFKNVLKKTSRWKHRECEDKLN